MYKRLAVLLLSISTIVAYGYALGGLGSYAMGAPRPLPTAAGLICGTIFAIAALKIWKSYVDDIDREETEKEALNSGGKDDNSSEER